MLTFNELSIVSDEIVKPQVNKSSVLSVIPFKVSVGKYHFGCNKFCLTKFKYLASFADNVQIVVKFEKCILETKSS